jgi:5-methylcytosine-specific restriction endonuclease McrA
MLNKVMKTSPQLIAKQNRIVQYNLMPNRCIYCNNPLGYDKRHYKFCDHSCSASQTNRRKIKHGKFAEKECIICKKITVNPKYCSKSCMAIGKTKYKTIEEKLLAKRAYGRESFARYSARKKYQTPVDADIAAIKLFYLNCPPGYEVDHILPISKGGEHTLSNLQYLTGIDNKRKNAKLNWCS